ncbi:anti-repressor protein [Lachnospiraceae bacterium PFB1-21]
MNELQIFANEEFGEIRTVQLNNETYFVGKDVAEALGYANPKNAVPTHVQDDDKLSTRIEYAGQRREVTVINESGLYALIFGSKLESAKRFKHWVTSEVLPSIRKNGSYGVQPQGKDLLALAVLEAQKVIEEQASHIERMRPKEIFADAVSVADDSILVGELAKLIKQNGYDIGQNRLFEWLREQGYLIKGGSDRNIPTQRSMEMKLFEIKERTISNPDGSVRTTRTTKVTGKGQIYFVNKFVGKSLAVQ